MGESFVVIMAADDSAWRAQADSDAPADPVTDTQVQTQGAILIEREAGGRVKAPQTGDHLAVRAWAGAARLRPPEEGRQHG